MPHINVNGINIYYETYGEGKPLVLIAGYSGNTLAWQPVAHVLAKHFQVVVFDNRGAGLTEVPDGPYSIELMADDTMALITALGLEQPHICGNSLGGSIVQDIAHRYPDKVDKVIISNSSNRFNAQIQFACRYFLERYENNDDLLEQAKMWLPFLFSSKFISKPENVQLYLELSVNNPKPISYKGLKNQTPALTDFDSTGWLDKIKNPCLILAGDEDIICLPKETEVLHKNISNSKLHVFKDCGHLPQVEYYQEFPKVVLDFLG